MSDNTMQRLRCETALHGPMERRLADRQPYAGPYSVWVCLTCGLMAVHLEWCGDIHWYSASAATRVDESWPEGLEANASHLAKCD